MILNRTMSSIFVLLMLQLTTYSQTYPKTLLWRISGHGLQQPSYLYGTMHLNDKRLFNFGDSVYKAIEASAGLAIEVNPDEMVAYLVNNMFDQLENSKKLRQLLKEKDFDKYSSALAKKFNKPAADITAADVVKEKNKWMTEYMEKGEMPTFMDAHLYNIARRQGKWLGGIEDMGDQAGLLEDMVDKSDIDYLLAGDNAGNSAVIDSGMKKMIDLYTSQDLEGIEAFTNGGSTPEKIDRILIQRNIKMARRMDSLVNLRTMFLAVGAAHLPGESGVIYLLRKRGFTVEPVFSSQKINIKNYTFKEVRIPWVQVDDNRGLYQTSMPGNPASIKVQGLVDMKFLLDIFNMAGYCTMAVSSPSDFTQKDSLYKKMAMGMFQSEKPLPSTSISQNGIEGREYIQEKKGANLRLQLFFYNKVVYVTLLYSMKAAGMHSEDADRFFAALKINKNAPVASTASVFCDSVMGVRLSAPAAISFNQKLSNFTDEGWKIAAFSGSDLSTGSYFLLYSKEVKPGHYLPSDSIIYTDFYENLKKQYTNLQKEEKWLQGAKITRFTGRNIEQPAFYMSAASALRNGRNIVLVAVTDSTRLHSPGIENFFTSLEFIPHPAVQWKTVATPGNDFSSMSPAPFVSTTVANNNQFNAYDTTTSISYYIIPDTLSKYFWAKDDSAYWKARLVDNLGQDSLLLQKAITNGDLTGIEMLSRERQSETRYKRVRLLQQGDRLHKIFVSAERDFLYSKEVNSFFESFRSTTPYRNDHFITTPKTNILLADLLSADSATRVTAFNWLDNAPFTETGREALQQALFKQYQSPYDTVVATTINYGILDKLLLLDSTATTRFVKNAYGLFTENKETSRNIALSLLAKLHTTESYAALASLLQTPPGAAFDYVFTSALRDSLPLTTTLYPVLQQLVADTLYSSSIANIANELLDSSLITMEKIKPAEPDFIKAAKQLLPSLLHATELDYDMYELLTLLGRFNDAAANKVLKDYLAVDLPWLRKRAAMELVGNGQPVAAALLEKMAADKNMRIVLYNELVELKKKALFPAKYATQALFAEAAMYSTATDDEEEQVNAMHFLVKKTAVFKKKTYTFYLYKITLEGEDGPLSYLGIQGGYAGGTALETALDLSGVYYKKPFDAKKINSLLAEFLKDQESNEDEALEE